MLFDYCIPRYKCTNKFKTLCNLTHTCGTLVFGAFNFGPHIFTLSLLTLKGGQPLSFSQFDLSLSFPSLFLSSLLEEVEEGKIKKEKKKGKEEES